MTDSRRGFLRKTALAGTTAALGASALDTATAQEFVLGEVVHTTVSLNVRDGPGTGYTVIDTEPPAMRGTVKDGPAYADGYEWYYVEFDDDRYESEATGWCATEGTWLQSGFTYNYEFDLYDGVHATDWVNIRDGPGTGYSDIGTAAPGDTGEVTRGPESSDGYTWWYVEFHDNTDGWVAGNWLAEGTLYGCDSAWDNSDNRWALGKIITSEASVGTDVERRGVAYTVLNRMDRNGTDYVTEEWDAYAHSQDPTSSAYDLATDVLRCAVADPSCGATHFYSPRSMPKEGDDTTGCACGGGLEWTPGLDERNYCPSWSETYYRAYVEGSRQAYYKFYRKPGNGTVY